MHRLLVVTNTAAGDADDDNVSIALEVLRSRADVQVAECGSPDDLDAILGSRDGRRLVVAGGDGSLQVTVATLRSRGELSRDDALALLPMGTGNDLARALGVPLEPAPAAECVLGGTSRHLDLLVDDSGGVVVNVVHVGVGAEAAEAASGMKDAFGRVAYPVGGAVAGARARGWVLRVEVDGVVVHEEEPALMVGVCNGRSIGGGAELAPDARPDDGLLDVVVVTSTGPLARFGFGVAMRSGDHVEREDVLAVRGRLVTVSGDAFPLNADGEVRAPVTRRTWSVEPAAWALIAPS